MLRLPHSLTITSSCRSPPFCLPVGSTCEEQRDLSSLPVEVDFSAPRLWIVRLIVFVVSIVAAVPAVFLAARVSAPLAYPHPAPAVVSPAKTITKGQLDTCSV